MVVVLVCIPTNSVRGFLIVYTLFSLVVCKLFDDGHSERCEMIPHCGFDLHVSNDE